MCLSETQCPTLHCFFFVFLFFFTFDLEGWPWPFTSQNVHLHEIHMHAKYQVAMINIAKVMTIFQNLNAKCDGISDRRTDSAITICLPSGAFKPYTVTLRNITLVLKQSLLTGLTPIGHTCGRTRFSLWLSDCPMVFARRFRIWS